MKAVVFHAHGPLENMAIEEWPEPQPDASECLVKVHAVALNGFDPMILRGIPGLKTPLPMIPGADIAGEIVALGAAVDRARWKVGDRVQVIPNQTRIGMMGETLRGGACERIAIDQGWLLPIPEPVSYVEAACLPTAYGAALRMMATRGKVAKGEKVLILGASGGVGTCCVQLAKLVGAHVIAVTSSADKAAKLAALGADHVIDGSQRSYVDEVVATYGKPRTWGGGGVDVVVNYTGGETWRECFRTLTRNGRLLTCGATAGYAPPTDIRYIWSFEFNIIGSNSWTPDDQRELLAMVADRRLKPVIHRELPLAAVRDGMLDLIERRAFGKVVLRP
jgi:alcohol dehydrogenase